MIVECRDQERTAEITWQPGRENYAPVLNFVVQYNTSFSPDTWIDIDANVSQNVRQKKVNLSPYGNYTFRVLARNKIGLSPPSVHTYIMCKTDQDVPDKNPDNVMAEGDMPGNLVIYWTVSVSVSLNYLGPGRFEWNFRKIKLLFSSQVLGSLEWDVKNDWSVPKLPFQKKIMPFSISWGKSGYFGIKLG